MKKLSKWGVEIFATCFYVGRIKIMPGTLGSLMAFLLIPVLEPNFLWGLIILALLIVGTITAHQYAKIYAKKDPKEVIIDEFVSQLMIFYLLMLALDDVNWLIMIASFILFRFFDIYKPFPISFVDQKIEGGIGIMLDDILAALFSFVIIWFVYFIYVTQIA